jgi:hypothetical protein
VDPLLSTLELQTTEEGKLRNLFLLLLCAKEKEIVIVIKFFESRRLDKTEENFIH